MTGLDETQLEALFLDGGAVRVRVVDVGDRDLDVDDRLRQHVGNRCRPDMVHLDDRGPDSFEDTRCFAVGLLGPLGVVRKQPDGIGRQHRYLTVG